MENTVYSDELQHHGTKGMKWGRRLYQNKDGSLTPLGQKRYNKEVDKLKKETAKVKEAEKVAANKKKTQSKFDKLEEKKQALEERKKALKGGKDSGDDKPQETVEQRRERLLKSTNPKELYEGKDVLTSQELNERVMRIDLESRLQSKIPVEPPKPGALDYMDKASNAINKATNLYRSVDNAYSTVSNSAIGKMLAKQLGIETPKKEFDLAETWKNRNKLSTQEMMDLNKRLTAEDQIKLKIDARNKAAQDERAAKVAAKQAEKDAKAATKKATETERDAQKQVDDYNERWQKGEVDDKVSNPDTTYSKKSDDIFDNKVATGKSATSRLLLEDKSKVIDVEPEELRPVKQKTTETKTPMSDEEYKSVVKNQFEEALKSVGKNSMKKNNRVEKTEKVEATSNAKETTADVNEKIRKAAKALEEAAKKSTDDKSILDKSTKDFEEQARNALEKYGDTWIPM